MNKHTKHIYTLATTVLVDIESDEELTTEQISSIMDDEWDDYKFQGEGRFHFVENTCYRVGDSELENWELVSKQDV